MRHAPSVYNGLNVPAGRFSAKVSRTRSAQKLLYGCRYVAATLEHSDIGTLHISDVCNSDIPCAAVGIHIAAGRIYVRVCLSYSSGIMRMENYSQLSIQNSEHRQYPSYVQGVYTMNIYGIAAREYPMQQFPHSALALAE